MEQDEFNLMSSNNDEVDLAKDLSITPEPEDLESFSHSDNELSQNETQIDKEDSPPPSMSQDFDDDFVLPDSVAAVSTFNGDSSSASAVEKEKNKKRDQKSRKEMEEEEREKMQ